MTTLDSARLTEQVLDCFPSGSYALSALLRLMDIEVSTEVPTAAVECKRQPRMLINPDFVATHAGTPEKLLMLVMHELHHVLLGHTTLFPTLTPVQNFIFDAVINALLCRMFPLPEYVALFHDFIDNTQYPHCLLGPPVDWGRATWSLPAGITQLPRKQREAVGSVYRALYSETGASYSEVYEILPRYLTQEQVSAVPLLGGHQPSGALGEGVEPTSSMLFDLVRGVAEHWPQGPSVLQGHSLHAVVEEQVALSHRPPSARRVLGELIRRVADLRKGHSMRHLAPSSMVMDGPLPSLSRRAAVQSALGLTPLLQPNSVPLRRKVDAGERVHVYLDVSGSVNSVRSTLYGAILDAREWVHPKVHLFSRHVADVTLRELAAGRCITDGGTDIKCVAEHMERHRVKRALLVTDGYVGKPVGHLRSVLARTRLGVAYPGTQYTDRDLAEVANVSRQLPLGG